MEPSRGIHVPWAGANGQPWLPHVENGMTGVTLPGSLGGLSGLAGVSLVPLRRVCGRPPTCFPPISGWWVPDQQPGDQQGASQARLGILGLQAAAGPSSFLLFPSQADTWPPLAGRRAPLRGTPRPSHTPQKETALIGPATTPGRAPDPASCRDRSPA